MTRPKNDMEEDMASPKNDMEEDMIEKHHLSDKQPDASQSGSRKLDLLFNPEGNSCALLVQGKDPLDVAEIVSLVEQWVKIQKYFLLKRKGEKS